MVPTTSEERMEQTLQSGGPAALSRDGPIGWNWSKPKATTWADRRVAACSSRRPPESLGDASFRGSWPAAPLRLPGDGQRDRLRRDCRGDGRAGMLGIFGAAGLSPQAVDRPSIRQALLGTSQVLRPTDPQPNGRPRSAVVDLYLRRRVRLVEALGCRPDLAGRPLQVEVIAMPRAGFMSQPDHCQGFPSRGRLEGSSRCQAVPQGTGRVRRGLPNKQLASKVRWPPGTTAEADSGGHTRKPQPGPRRAPAQAGHMQRSAIGSSSSISNYGRSRIGAAGGISTPWSAAAAFAMGASYVLVGSVNQSCVESGTSGAVRSMLAQTRRGGYRWPPRPTCSRWAVGRV